MHLQAERERFRQLEVLMEQISARDRAAHLEMRKKMLEEEEFARENAYKI